MLVLTIALIGILAFDLLALRFGADSWKQSGSRNRW